jgi:hypothetical protein
MESDNWIVENIQNALDKWGEKLSEIWTLLTTSPENFKGGGIWSVILNINDALTAVGLGLLILFFLVGVVKTCGSFAELKKPEHAIKLFVRFIIAKAVITHGLELMMMLFGIVQGIMAKIMAAAGFSGGGSVMLPDEMVTKIEDLGFLESIPLWLITLIGGLVIWVLSFIILLTVYGRFFKVFMYTAIAPVPLSTFAGEPTQSMGVNFLRSYAAVCLEGAIIALACIIFSLFASTPPEIATDASAVTQVWSYLGELIFTMLVLVGTVKMSDRIVREMIFGG